MIRSILSGVSGMRTHQIRMDVIGDNISNVNTSGFKSNRADFMTTLSQTLISGGGGRNPAQVGTGMRLAGISGNFEQGPLQSTGRTLDVAIEGKGFYMLQDSNSGNVYYTREGVFLVDAQGYIINSSGLRLCDESGDVLQIDLPANETIKEIQIDQQGQITGKFTDAAGTAFGPGNNFVNCTGIIGLTIFPNPEGLEKYGQTLYQQADPTSPNPTEGTPVTGQPGTGGFGTLNSGYLEMSNVNLTDEFASMITTQRGYQANARIITVSDTMLEELIQLKR